MGRNATSPAYNLVQVCTATRRCRVRRENFSGDASAWYSLLLGLFRLWLLTRLRSGANEDEDDDAVIQEDLLAVLKVGLIFICHVRPFIVAQSTVPSSHEEPLTVDLSDSEPICMMLSSSDLVLVLIELCKSRYQHHFLVK